jgi:hypothetical protein
MITASAARNLREYAVGGCQTEAIHRFPHEIEGTTKIRQDRNLPNFREAIVVELIDRIGSSPE